MKKSELKQIIREEIKQIRQIREYSKENFNYDADILKLKGDIDRQNFMRNLVDKRVGELQNRVKDLEDSMAKPPPPPKTNPIKKLESNVKTIETNLDLIAKKVGVKLKR